MRGGWAGINVGGGCSGGSTENLVSQEGKIWILVDFIRSFSHLSKVGPGVDTVLIKGDSSRDHKTGQSSL